MGENKSVLDNVPVDDKAFPLREPYQGKKPNKPKMGQCPSCGAPIYGDPSVAAGDKPEVIYSCDCKEKMFRPFSPFVGQMETK